MSWNVVYAVIIASMLFGILFGLYAAGKYGLAIVFIVGYGVALSDAYSTGKKYHGK